MFQFIKVIINSSLSGQTGLSIVNKQGRISYCYDNTDMVPNIYIHLGKKESQDFIEGFKALNTRKWKQTYKGEEKIASAKWLLFIKDGKTKRVYQGDSAFPDNWDEFMDLLTNLSNESMSCSLNHLSGIFMSLSSQDYSEELLLERKDGTVSYKKVFGDTVRAEFIYRVPELIDQLLGVCEYYFLNADIEETRPRGNILETTLIYRSGERKTFKRSYTRNGISPEWDNVLGDIEAVLSMFGVQGMLFDRNEYKLGARKGEKIYCECFLPGSDTPGYFISEKDDLRIGELIEVIDPQGKENIELITDILYMKKSYPCPRGNIGKVKKKYI